MLFGAFVSDLLGDWTGAGEVAGAGAGVWGAGVAAPAAFVFVASLEGAGAAGVAWGVGVTIGALALPGWIWIAGTGGCAGFGGAGWKATAVL